MNQFIYKYFNFLVLLFLIIALASLTPFWYISFLSISFFLWNLMNERRYFVYSIVVISLTILLLIFNFSIIMPINKWGEKVQLDWNKTGYDKTKIESSQLSLNVLNRLIERYKAKNGFYPNSLDDLDEIYIFSQDYSYRVKEIDGQTNSVPFHYQKIDSNKFKVAGVGEDGIISTYDDLLPQLSKDQEKITGLSNYVIKSFTYQEIEEERKYLRFYDRNIELKDKFKQLNIKQ